MISLKIGKYTAKEVYQLYRCLIAAKEELECAEATHFDGNDCESCKHYKVCGDISRSITWLEQTRKM